MFPFTSRIWLTRAVALITCLTLIVAAGGIFENFTLLRTISAVCLLIFGILTLVNGYRKSGAASIILGLIYYPVLGIVFPRHIWTILDVILVVSIVFIVYKTTDSYQKGTTFEKYVAGLFPAQNFAIETRTHDSSKTLKRFVETDVNPDFVFRNKTTGRSFAIECKWRKGWAGSKSIGLGLYWDLWKADHYTRYGARYKMPVFVAFGIGGTPENPNEVYFLEAEKLRFPFLKESLIKSGKTKYQLADLKI